MIKIEFKLSTILQTAVLIGVIGLPALVSAAPIFTAAAGAVGTGDSQTGGSRAIAGASSSRERDWGVEGGSGLAYADISRLGAFGSASIQPILYEYQEGLFGYGRLNASGSGRAFVRFDDIVFSGTGNGASSALVSTNIFVEGILSASGSSAGRGLSNAGVSIGYGLGVPAPGSTAVLQTVGSATHTYNNGTFSSRSSGILSVLDPAEVTGFSRFFESPSFEVPLNTPVSLAIELSAGASVTTQDGGSMSALVDFSQSLVLGYGGHPVFVLPEGITANSLGAGIVNNQIPAQFPVPIPPTISLLASAIAGLIAFRVDRRKIALT